MADAETFVVRFEIPRSTFKARGDEIVAAEAIRSLQMGISRAVDFALLGAIYNATPAAFTLAAAAAAGVKFSELRAIAGINGTGVSVNAAGQLNVSGVPAELTSEHSMTVVGAFQHSAVAIGEEIQVIVDRLDRSGEVAISAWVELLPLIPNADFFWAVPA